MFWLWVTMIMSFAAGVANLSTLRVKRYGRDPFTRPYLIMHAVIGFGAFGYTFAYGLLIFTDVDRGAWSTAMAPFSALAFFSVWLVPALLYRIAASARLP